MMMMMDLLQGACDDDEFVTRGLSIQTISCLEKYQNAPSHAHNY
jgi:hypothetical protein